MADEDRIAAVARALAHPARVRIVKLLARQTECRGADVFGELPLAQSTISEHLRFLKEAGVISSRPEGTRMIYCLTPGAFDDFLSVITGITMAASPCLAREEGC
jgi:ArsR family transcriptional regulator, arsenate/arsenite/antimonite-responsive transcriptional repressor